jgi:NAD(P)H dehydrogenase (quinone)
MKILVIIGHQHKGSFCHAIAERVVEEIKGAGHDVVFHDLYEEKFDPILPHEEIEADVADIDPVIREHLQDVLDTDTIVIVHPNWWGQPPAILKGWVDRVLRKGSVYEFNSEGAVGLLPEKTALVLTTSNTPRQIEKVQYGDPLQNLWMTCIFGLCGIADFYRHNFEPIVESTDEQRKEWLEEVGKIIRHQVFNEEEEEEEIDVDLSDLEDVDIEDLKI